MVVFVFEIRMEVAVLPVHGGTCIPVASLRHDRSENTLGNQCKSVRSFLSIILRYCVRCSRTRPDVYELCIRTEREITLPNLKCCSRIDDAFRLRLEFLFEKRGDNRKKECYFERKGEKVIIDYFPFLIAITLYTTRRKYRPDDGEFVCFTAMYDVLKNVTPKNFRF